MGIYDIIALILFAAIVFALWKVFSGDDDTIQPVNGNFGRGHALKAPVAAANPLEPLMDETSVEGGDDTSDIEEKLYIVSRRVKGFNPHDFMESAGEAFKSILESYNTGDLEKLEKGVSTKVFSAIKTSSDEFAKKGLVLNTEFVRIKRIAITDAGIEGNLAFVDVFFDTEQISTVKNAKGEIVQGDENKIETIEDNWRFVRDLTNKSSLWTLDESVKEEE